MYITERHSGRKHKVVIEPVTDKDYRVILKSRFFFNWKTEKTGKVYKLRCTDSNTILGLISLKNWTEEKRIEIKLLSVSVENRGRSKQCERITGTLIAYACRNAVKYFGKQACVSLVPKTDLRQHYMKKYGMQDAGWQIFLEGLSLLKILNEYIL